MLSGTALLRPDLLGGGPASLLSDRQAVDLSRVRRELRDRLMAGTAQGADDALARLGRSVDHAAAHGGADAAELRAEHDRWRLRFELLAAADDYVRCCP